ncbi:MAG TPA: methyltransferase domain-containing protein [Anaerolineales bacterium]|nr:methyltransferase domain-containing protein [Anaerolineales bacterium]
MRRPSRLLALGWLLLALPPWAVWWSMAAPPWSAVALLLHAALFFGLGYLFSGRWGTAAGLLTALGLSLAQSAFLWAGQRLWALGLPPMGLLGALLGAWLWRWRVTHHGADVHFDLIAPWYERFIHPQRPEPLLESLALAPTHRVLDAGGGTGRVAQFLRPARSVVVADLSLAMLRLARQKPGVAPVAALAEALPFPSGTFDRVVMVDALHHLFDQQNALAELWRVLRPGGRLVIEEPDLDQPLVKLIALWEKAMLMRSHFLRPKAIATLLPTGAQVTIQRERHTARIIAEKPQT